jgi:hypothetical protein
LLTVDDHCPLGLGAVLVLPATGVQVFNAAATSELAAT